MIDAVDPADLIIRDVPIIIEPCVGVIEAACAVLRTNGCGGRVFPMQLYRLEPTSRDIDLLPFVTSTTVPHIFSLVPAVAESLLLLTYDHTGRLHMVYKRPAPDMPWNRYEVFDETVGRVCRVPSVRFRFQNEKQQKRFLALAEALIKQENHGVVNYDDVAEFTKLLSRLRTPPVAVPVSIPVRVRNSM